MPCVYRCWLQSWQARHASTKDKTPACVLTPTTTRSLGCCRQGSHLKLLLVQVGIDHGQHLVGLDVDLRMARARQVARVGQYLRAGRAPRVLGKMHVKPSLVTSLHNNLPAGAANDPSCPAHVRTWARLLVGPASSVLPASRAYRPCNAASSARSLPITRWKCAWTCAHARGTAADSERGASGAAVLFPHEGSTRFARVVCCQHQVQP